LCHLPALAATGPFELTALVDTDTEQARAAAKEYLDAAGGDRTPPVTAADAADIAGAFDAALVATPPATHIPLTRTLIRAGKHVLVEKPVACSVAELDELAGAVGDQGGPVVAVAQVRRLFPVARWVRDVVADGMIGRVQRIRWAEGVPFEWPVVSAFPLGPAASGGGVLQDIGPHVLDLLSCWLEDPGTLISFAHNTIGGTDTEIEMRVIYGDTLATISLSRLRTLANTVILEGSRGTIQVDVERAARYIRRDAGGTVVAEGQVPADPPETRTRDGLFGDQLVEFRRAIEGEPTRLPRPQELRPLVELIERCRREPATPLSRPWTLDRRPVVATESRPPRVAVTGASGFIGANIVETLADTETRVTAIGHRLPAFTRLAHLDHARIGCVPLDVRDTDALRRTLDGHDVVVHAAYGNSGTDQQRWSVTVDGTTAIVRAAMAAGVRRLVLLSSMSVYRPVPILHEDCRRITPDPQERTYAAAKHAAEQLAFDLPAAGQMEVVSLQPGVVYGPWGPNWTVRAIDQLRADNRSLPSGHRGGISNAVHVIDVAAAIAFLVTDRDVAGQCFLLSGPDPATWGQFYDHYRTMAGLPHHGNADDADWPEWLRGFYAEPWTIDSGRLRRAGFTSEIDLESGMAQVAGWAAWAGLL
jgi:predicted dehydrogenase/nucleoside-diphosphate-sugar epimerase